jgi:hypothetical protein
MSANDITAAVFFSIFLVIVILLLCVIFACECHRRKRVRRNDGTAGKDEGPDGEEEWIERVDAGST